MSIHVDHVSKVNQDKAISKIERKLQALSSYVETGVADFNIPRKFSLNWFADWEDESKGYKRVSKSGKQLRKGTDLHDKIYSAFNEAQEKLDNTNTSVQVKSKSAERIEQLEADVKGLEKLVSGLAQNTVDLMLELEHYKQQLGLSQAQWRDQMQRITPVDGG